MWDNLSFIYTKQPVLELKQYKTQGCKDKFPQYTTEQ